MTTNASIQLKRFVGLCLATTFGLISCTTQNQPTDPNQAQPATALQEVANPVVPTAPGIQIDGSSTVFPISDAIAKTFKQTQGEKAGQIDVKFSGTGGGFRKFCAGQTDINGASRPILKEEMEVCGKNGVRYIELPVAFDALTIVINPQNT